MTKISPNRVHAGIPTGGQFASHNRPDAEDLVLMSDAEMCAATKHLVVGDEFPYCTRCLEEFDELSSLFGHDETVDAAWDLDKAEMMAAVDAANAVSAKYEAMLARTEQRASDRVANHYSDQPIGYTYKAEHHLPAAVVQEMIAAGLLSPAARSMNPVEAIEMAASANAIDFEDLYSFDSDDFPKPIFVDQINEDDDADWLGAPTPDDWDVEGWQTKTVIDVNDREFLDIIDGPFAGWSLGQKI
jgi:hypothetical protein